MITKKGLIICTAVLALGIGIAIMVCLLLPETEVIVVTEERDIIEVIE